MGGFASISVSVLSLPLVLETEEGLVERVKVQKVSRPQFLIVKLKVDIFGWVKQSSSVSW
jgi:hypothetical protein